MGCYGIGVGRTVAAAIEQCHDEYGIIFPERIAPFQVEILPVQTKNEQVVRFSERVYETLRTEGWEVLLDDRDIRPGVKFKDADLIGIPWRIVVGRKFADEGKIEIKSRQTGDVVDLPAEKVMTELKKRVSHD